MSAAAAKYLVIGAGMTGFQRLAPRKEQRAAGESRTCS